MKARPLNNRLDETGFTQVGLFVLGDGSVVRHVSARDNLRTMNRVSGVTEATVHKCNNMSTMDIRDSSGFTFIEMLMVVVLMAAIMAMSLPRIRNAAVKESVRGARLAVSTQVARARGTAATRGCPAVLHVVAGTNARTWITSCPTAGTGIDTVGAIDHMSASLGVAVVSSLDSLTFGPNGIALASNWNVMRFSRNGYADTLAISPVGRPVW